VFFVSSCKHGVANNAPQHEDISGRYSCEPHMWLKPMAYDKRSPSSFSSVRRSYILSYHISFWSRC